MSLRLPLVQPLGDSALVVRFSDVLDDAANATAVRFAGLVDAARLGGVVEVVPNLVSVLLRYDALERGYDALAGEVRLVLGGMDAEAPVAAPRHFDIVTRYGGAVGPDLEEVAALAGLTAEALVAAHAGADLRVLATGFAPGFVYCGFHPEFAGISRRTNIRPQVPAGTILFAAGQTAIAATPVPTGWHVIGHTDFINFDPLATPPTRLRAGDRLRFPDAAG